MLTLLTSDMASSAVLRLTLRLVFAAYILHPHLSGMKPPVGVFVLTCVNGCCVDFMNRFMPNWPTKVIRTYLSRIYSTGSVIHGYNGDDKSLGRSSRDRFAFAMILVLCSVGYILPPFAKLQRVQLAKQTNYSGGETSREFPHRYPPEVLYLIRAVIHPESVLFPFAHPDGPQTVLLCWGQVIPWCWTVWDDTRFANFELITQLVCPSSPRYLK